MAYLPTIDVNACAAQGDCLAIAPEVFALDDTALVIGTAPDDLILAAARICPSAAIVVIADHTGEQVFP